MVKTGRGKKEEDKFSIGFPSTLDESGWQVWLCATCSSGSHEPRGPGAILEQDFDSGRT